MGDVHQPLPVSFKDDRGGNAILAQGPCRDDLHAVWDTCLIERTLGKDIRELAAELRARVTAAERAARTGTGAKDWANESFAITTSAAVRYGVKTETGCWYAENKSRHLGYSAPWLGGPDHVGAQAEIGHGVWYRTAVGVRSLGNRTTAVKSGVGPW